MAMPAFKIGQLAKAAGTSAPTIRYYEEIGLLPRAARAGGNHRAYNDDDIRRLTFIRRCREFGFSIEQVKLLVALIEDGDRSCTEARDLAHTHLLEVRKKLDELRQLERAIAASVENCEKSCAGGPGADCIILGELGSVSATGGRE